MIKVSKYNASGNDFVIFHSDIKEDRSTLAKILCHRNSGVGADGLIVILPHSAYDFQWQFYNSDGSSAGMCGNGSRACAHYALKHALAPASMKFLTDSGVIEAIVEGDIVETSFIEPKVIQSNIKESNLDFVLIDTGVPHLVAFTKDDFFDEDLARELRYKYNANVNFARLVDGELYVRTYERGVEGETGACGTGMAACFYKSILDNDSINQTTVYPTSKEKLYFRIKNNNIYFKGKVTNTFDAKYYI